MNRIARFVWKHPFLCAFAWYAGVAVVVTVLAVGVLLLLGYRACTVAHGAWEPLPVDERMPFDMRWGYAVCLTVVFIAFGLTR